MTIEQMADASILLQIYIHTDNLDKLYEFVPKDLLPNEYGGKAGNFEDLASKFKIYYLCRDASRTPTLHYFHL